MSGERGGYLAIAAAILIWAAWLPATRFAVGDAVAALDLAFLRYGVPALVLLPIWLPLGLWPRGVTFGAGLMMLGWGAPFVILVAKGFETASTAHAAAMVPSMMPLFAVLLNKALFGIAPNRNQWIGLPIILLGASFVIVPLLADGTPRDMVGVAYLLLGSCGWACFTLAFRRTGLTPVQATGIVCAQSTVLVGIALAIFGTSLNTLSVGAIAFHATAQGLLSGVIATIAYALAIERLGPPRASSFSALVPGMAALIGFAWLGEAPSTLDLAALFFASIGVATVNGAFDRRPSGEGRQ